jgi:hypothetical protein
MATTGKSCFNQKQELHVAAMFVNQSGQNEQFLLMDQDEMSNLYRGPSIDASYQVSVHLVEGFQRHISVGSIYGSSSVKIAHSVPIR